MGVERNVMPSARIGTIDALRGVASCSVVWFHSTHGIPNFLPAGAFKASGTYGWLGVQMFFVISGFVIPYALYNAGYERHDFGRFLAKRITRLHPPYLVSIILALIIAYKLPQAVLFGAGLARPDITLAQILAHLCYLNSMIGKPWLVPAYWSLGIEFQFYLLTGLLFSFLTSSRLRTRLQSTAAMLIPSLVLRQHGLLFVHMPIFVVGIATFQTRVGLLSNRIWAAVVLVASGVIGVTSGIPAAVVAVLCGTVILHVKLRSRVWCWLGMISYSLYLVHGPIGGTLLMRISRFTPNPSGRTLAVLFAVGVSIVSAYLFYRAVELPSQHLSSRLSYEVHTRRGSALAVEAAGEIGASTYGALPGTR